MLILDFDGVVCDAFEECALVTWYAASGAEAAAKPPGELAAALPSGFVERFRAVRKHSRLLDHFLVALDPRSERLSGRQDDFDALFDGLPDDERRNLVAGANAVRAGLRQRHRSQWLAMHTLYPGVRELLERHEGRTNIVTAKDEASVWEILGHHGLDHTVVSVIGECADKRTAVLDLVEGDGLRVEHATFIDDNLRNALQVRDTGVRTLWAYWGYHTAEHVHRALARKMPRVYLPELAGLTA